MLTRKQHELLFFIKNRLQSDQIAPSFDEMRLALNLKSKSGIHRLVSALEERGFIRRLPNKARALEIIKLPSTAASSKDSFSVKENSSTRAFSPNVIPGNFPKSASVFTKVEKNVESAIELPMYGRIAAGNPIEALADESSKILVPPHLLSNGEHYALEVEGDSMIEVGIFNGDTAIIERCETAENGTIVVALIDESEVTLKRLRKRNHSIALEAANPEYETRIFGPDQVKLQGRLVGIMRKY
jgi:repressor LexA